MTVQAITKTVATICPCCGRAVPVAPVVPLPTIGGGGGVEALNPVPVPLPFLDIPGGGWRDGTRPQTPAEVFGEPLFNLEEWGLLPPWLGTAIGAPPETRQLDGINFPLTLPLTQWP